MRLSPNLFILLFLGQLFIYGQEVDTLKSNIDQKANSYLKKLQTAYANGDYEQHKLLSDSLVLLGKTYQNTKFQVLGMVNQAIYFNNRAQQDKAIRLYRNALELCDASPEDYRSKIIVLVNLGNVYNAIGSHNKAINAMQTVLSLLDENEDNPKIRASAYNGLATNYQKIGQLDKVLEYHSKTKELGLAINNEIIVATAFNSISELYFKEKKFKKAKLAALDGLNLKHTAAPTKERAWLLTSLALAKWKLGEIEAAITFLEEATKIAQTKKLNQIEAKTYLHLSDVLKATGNLEASSKAKESYLQIQNEILATQQDAIKVDLQKDLSDKNAIIKDKDRAIFDLAQNESKFKKFSLVFGGCLVLLSSLLLFYRIKTKKQNALLREQFLVLQKETEEPLDTQQKSSETETKQKASYKSSSINDEDFEAYKARLTSHIKSNRPYLDSELSQKDLAEQINISSHHLSEVLNKGFNQNFYNYINSYRIRAAQEMLKNKKHKETKLIAIAFDSGFKSKTTFNRLFKDYTGLTPSEYRSKFLG
ncbi:AraC family transcriptional regulator [Croceivirga sp. JEA036]|uniref:AraC family transcriptional regulator n=1 Tax=Croceivirga sp. JEA036 TaxID=2721162 RepID=UPI00143A2920|nr:AraC family transcriptional regulator [Croceivirga sp. JEA036]NJB36719.1 helix-turn-helix domain-containing protein [Croceivirga sp. JEA036]